jgi:RHS repeat-associated protein
VESVVDANGMTWTTTLDSLGRATQKLGPQGQVLSTATFFDSYPAYSVENTYVEQNKGFATTVFRDGSGQEIARVRTGAGVQPVRTSYVVRDAFGQPVASYHPINVATKKTYTLSDLWPAANETPAVARFDSFGRQVYAATPDGRETFTDYWPAETWVTSPKGYATRTQVDWRGNIRAVDQYAARHSVAIQNKSRPVSGLTYERDGLGKLLRVVDGDGTVRDLSYDGLGRLYKAGLPYHSGAQPEMATLCYDEHDDLIEYVGASGKVGAIDRDELGRAVHSIAEDPMGGGAPVHVYASYDNPAQGSFALGRMWRVLDESGVSELSYSDLGQISQVAYSPSRQVSEFGGKPMDVARVRLSMGYSLMGALTNATVQGTLRGRNAPTVEYGQYRFTLDSLGRTTLVSEPSSPTYTLPFGVGKALISNTRYDAFDSLVGVSLGSDIEASWEYEPLSHRLKDARYSLSGELDPFVRLSYGYDPNDNIVSERRFLGNGGSYAKRHIYDALDRLTASDGIKDGKERRLERMEYSPGGNVLKVNGLTYQYGDASNAHAVTRVVGAGYQRELEYDRDGALEYDEDQEREVSLEYDASECLRRVEADVPGETVVNEYICNQEGKRSARLTRRGTNIERVIYIGDLLELRPDDGEQGEVRVRLPLAGSAVFEDIRDLRSGLRDEERSGYLVKDIRGSVLAKVSYDLNRDLPRVEYEEAEYTAWGETLSLSNLPRPTHQFVDHEPDPGVGYYQFGVRTYDPTLKRWLSPDPLFFGNPELDTGTGAQLNLYAYAANNPVKNIDTTGNAAESVWDMASLVMGVLSLKDNVSKGNVGGAVVDGLGILLDGAALALPFVPGGVGAALKLVRGADKVNDLRTAARTTDAAATAVQTAKNVDNATTATKAASNVPTPKTGAGAPKVEAGAGSSTAGSADVSRGTGSANSPKSSLPRDKQGNYLPDPKAQGAHTTLGTRQGRNGDYVQGATFDKAGNFKGRTDVTNHGRGDHSNPHFHPANGPNSVKKGDHSIPKPEDLKLQ